MLSLRKQGDLVRIYFGSMPVLVVNSPALIREVLVSQRDKFEKGALFDKTRPVLGNGLVTSGGEFHRRQRRLIQPAFRPERIALYGEHMAELARERVASWRPGQVVAVDREMTELTLAVVSRSLFASRIGRDAAAEVQRSLPIVVHGFMRRTVAPTTLLERIPTPGNRRFDAARARLRAITDEVIAAYRADPTDHGDLLSILAHAHDADHRMSDSQLRDELITMMLAGTDTTAVALAWAFHELGRHPEVERRVQTEVDRVICGRKVTSSDASRLEYTGRVVNEALRLHTPPWIFMRRTIAPVKVGSAYLPVGSEVAVSPAALHRDQHLYPNPMRFDPDRWLRERADRPPRAAFIPFGTGDRQCIGDSYAVREMTIVIAAVAARLRLRPVPGSRVREVAGMLLRPSALPMVAEPRDPSQSEARSDAPSESRDDRGSVQQTPGGPLARR